MDMNTRVKNRREALGLSQTVIAARVSVLSGTDFTQQSLARFENKPGAQSTFLHYILRALDEAEGKVSPTDDPAMVREMDPPAYADIVDKLRTADAQGKLSPSLRGAILNMIDAAAPGLKSAEAPAMPSVKNAPSIEQAQRTVDLLSNAEQQREFAEQTIKKIRAKPKTNQTKKEIHKAEK